MAMPNSLTGSARLEAFVVARRDHPSYRERLMGQQHRRTVKRRRREAYLERKKAKAKAAAPAAKREPAAKPKAKKPASAAA
jgi:hypothetical protein